MKMSYGISLCCASALCLLLDMGAAQASTFERLFAFPDNYADGEPLSVLVVDAQGNLTGTTLLGCQVFQLNPTTDQFTQLHQFISPSEGCTGYNDDLTADASGTIYGAFNSGVFSLTPTSNYTLLSSIGAVGSVSLDAFGNIYGTTTYGGANALGSVFELSPSGVLTTLYSFTGAEDGAYPMAGVSLTASGTIFGTTSSGTPKTSVKKGSVFSLTQDGKFTKLHVLPKGNSGPLLAVGTTFYGTSAGFQANCGSVWKITQSGAFSFIHQFTGTPDGCRPVGRVVAADDGTLYGVTNIGGIQEFDGNSEGTIYSIKKKVLSIVYRFAGGHGGKFPASGLAYSQGQLYGTTEYGGNYKGNGYGLAGGGTVFKFTP